MPDVVLNAHVQRLERETQWKSQEEQDEFTAVTLRADGLFATVRWPADQEPSLGDQYEITIKEIPF